MKIKLHNKYEIIMGDKTYTAYNTITNKIFDAIYNFVNYGSHLAVGAGTEELGYDTSKLSSHIANFPTELEELQCDPSKGVMYAKRVAHVYELPHSFYMTEFGLTNEGTTQLESTVYSHAYVRDEDGNITKIFKEPDVDLFIRVTIYLQFDEQTQTMLTAGENPLVKAILGELYHTPIITVARGFNNSPNNTFIYRDMPRDAVKFDVSAKRISAEDGSTEQIEYSFDARSGETAELILLFDDTPVARLNTVDQGSRTILTLEGAVSQTNYTLDLGENVTKVTEVTAQDGTVVTDYKIRNYAKDFTDFIANPFEANFTSECARWVSYDGDKLAFVADNTVYIYNNENYSLKKIIHNISGSNLKQIVMFENFIFAIYTSDPFFKVYTFDESLAATELAVDLTNYMSFDTSFDWQEVQIIQNDSTNFLIGIVLGAIARRPVLVRASISEQTFVISDAVFGTSDHIVHSFSLYKNNFCNSMIGFVTNNHNGVLDNYRIEQWYPDYTSEITNEIPAYYLCNGTVVLEGKSRAVISKMDQSPYVWIYYYPQVYRYTISLTKGVQNWISTNLMYIIQKYTDADIAYKIYSLNDYDNPQEFLNGFPSEIDLSTVTDFEFLNDTLLIFTTEKTYALNLKINQTVLENMPQANATYNVSGEKIKLIGTDKTQGIMGSFSVVFSV